MKNLWIKLFCLTLVGCGVEAGGEGETSDGVATNEHRVFVTSASYDGAMNGLTGADSFCATAAEGAGLERDYQAILSDENTSAEDRLAITGAVYVVTDTGKDLVAGSGTELWNASNSNLLYAIDIDENGDSVGTQSVWTGTTSEGGSNAGRTCSDWTTNSGDLASNGFYGSTSATDANWLEDSFSSCNSSFRLYCISQ